MSAIAIRVKTPGIKVKVGSGGSKGDSAARQLFLAGLISTPTTAAMNAYLQAAAEIQAGLAADSAGLASSVTTLAVSSQQRASVSETNAAAAATAAQNSAIAAQVSGPVYDTISAGNAAVANGVQFKVKRTGGDGSDVYQRVDATPGNAVYITSYVGPPSYAALQAKLPRRGLGIGTLTGGLDGIAREVVLHATTGQIVSAVCEGIAGRSVALRNTQDGIAPLGGESGVSDLRFTGTSFALPAAEVDVAGTIINAPQQIVGSTEPEYVTGIVSPVFYLKPQEETRLAYQYVEPDSTVLVRQDTMATMARNTLTTYAERNYDRGVIIGGVNLDLTGNPNGVPVIATYNGWKQRCDVVSVDEAGVYTITKGAETPRTPELLRPFDEELPAGSVVAFDLLRLSGQSIVTQSYKFKDGLLHGDMFDDHWAEVRYNQGVLAPFRRDVMAGAMTALMGAGDSITQKSGVWHDRMNYEPNSGVWLNPGTGLYEKWGRQTIAFYDEAGDTIRNRVNPVTGLRQIPIESNWNNDDITGHIREGYFADPHAWAYRRYGPRGLALTGWGDKNADGSQAFFAYRNWGRGGTDSSADVHVDGSQNRFCLNHPVGRAAILADADLMNGQGRRVLLGVAMMQNELGSTATRANLIEFANAVWSTSTRREMVHLLFFTGVRRSPLHRVDHPQFLYSSREIVKAAHYVGAGIINLSRYFKRGFTGSHRYPDRMCCYDAVINHPTLHEDRMSAMPLKHVLS